MFNEAYEQRQKEAKGLLKKWDKALDGVRDEHLAITTAVLLENYLEHLHSDPRLIAEDQIQANAFSGVNLALLGLISRAIPTLVGAELVGIQAMPTPTSQIFTLEWTKDNKKGATSAGDEMWVTPVDHEVGIDPFYSSQRVDEVLDGSLTSAQALSWANVTHPYSSAKPFIFNNVYITGYDADGNAVADVVKADSQADGAFLAVSGAGTFAGTTFTWDADNRTITADAAVTVDGEGVAITKVVASYEYKQEGEGSIPEVSFNITGKTVSAKSRKLRGKFTAEAAYDLKKLHGINLESELTNMMKVELQAEINREIVSDLRMLAGISKTLDYAAFRGSTTGVSAAGNYNDSHQVLLDAINLISAEIHNQGRLGRANWVVGNPTTLAFLDRVPGFSGAGVTYNGKELSYAGSLGGKLKFYFDPNYPKGELLIGYKGAGALDTGYIHAPYLPITASPTIIDQFTGDPSKLYFTRYGKTFNMEGSTGNSLILNSQYQYGRLFLKNMPAPLNI